MSVDVNSPDWYDGFETASAERCFNERQELAHLRAQVEDAREALKFAELAASGKWNDPHSMLGTVAARFRAALTDKENE